MSVEEGPDWETIKDWKRTESKKYSVFYDPSGSGHWAWHKADKYWHWTSAAKINQANQWDKNAKNWQNWQKKQGGSRTSESMNWNQFQNHHKGQNISRETLQDLWRQYKANF